MSAKSFWAALLVLPLASLSSCREQKSDARARVDCHGKGETITCDITHEQGKVDLHVCWELRFTCENGTQATGAACQDVSPGAVAKKVIPASGLKNAEACDKTVGSEVINLKVTGK